MKRFIFRLRHWLWAPLWDLLGIVADGEVLTHTHLDRLEMIATQNAQTLARIEAILSTPTVTTALPPLIRWDCGHEHVSGSKNRHQITECLDCHQARVKADEQRAREA